MKFDLSALPPAAVGVPLPVATGAEAPKPGGPGSSVHGHNQQIDVNLTIASIARVAIGAFGLTATLAALSTEGNTRARLQCTLAAAVCAVTSLFYARFYAIRRSKGVAYSRAGNAAVDSTRYSCWCVTNGTLAWLGLLLHGPFQPTNPMWIELSYAQWLLVGPALSSFSVLCAGSAQFCAETARYRESWGAMLRWGALGLAFVLVAVGASTTTNLTLQQPGDETARTRTEIELGRALGRLWFVYPAANLTKIVLTFFTQHNSEELANLRLAPAVVPLTHVGWGVRDALLWSLRVVSSSHAYAPLPEAYEAEAETSLGYALVPPVYTQLFDALLAIVDLISVGLPALACTALALPVTA